jgi:hypothetical protein
VVQPFELGYQPWERNIRSVASKAALVNRHFGLTNPPKTFRRCSRRMPGFEGFWFSYRRSSAKTSPTQGNAFSSAVRWLERCDHGQNFRHASSISNWRGCVRDRLASCPPVKSKIGRQFITLEDVGTYITKLPSLASEAAEWQAAIEALILAATHGGPTMYARSRVGKLIQIRP